VQIHCIYRQTTFTR